MVYYYQSAFYLTLAFFFKTFFWKFYIMKFVLQLHKKEYISFHFIIWRYSYSQNRCITRNDDKLPQFEVKDDYFKKKILPFDCDRM